MTAFETAVEFVLKHEGGYVNDPADPGGETNFGISKRTYPALDIGALTRADAIEIYRRDYWVPSGADQIADPALALALFDTAVNAGVARAKEFLAQSGPDLVRFLTLRCNHYLRIATKRPASRKFLRGWLARVAAIVQWPTT